MQPTEPEEDLKELVARDENRRVDPKLERFESRRRERQGPYDDSPDEDWLHSNWAWLMLAAIFAALVAWIAYIALA
jgi:hypothetical protein